MAGAQIDQMLDIAVMLLEVMLAKEKAFSPNDLAVPRHSSPPFRRTIPTLAKC